MPTSDARRPSWLRWILTALCVLAALVALDVALTWALEPYGSNSDSVWCEYRQATELRFASYYNKHRDLWDSLPPVNRMQISNAVRSRSVNEGMMMEAVTIDGWLRHIAALASDAQGSGEGDAHG